ncbi:MAG: bifunctional DNA-formamidopyrimidine glycosylase/DNA-(apurinic or apyrimidinic site) lyase [Hyphomicrobiaceae bacterium]
MPELPEVETVRRGLEPAMTGKRIVRVELRRPDLRFPFPNQFAERIAGATVTSLGRRAKYVLVRLSTDETLIMHLGMSGRFSLAPPKGSTIIIGEFEQVTGAGAAHDHVVFEMSDGTIITYNDPRRFGAMDLCASGDLESHKMIAGLGIEPMGNELSSVYLASQAQGKKTDLKAFLLDQRIIAGLGNIYVCEVLFRSNLAPHRSASCLAQVNGRPTERAERLVPVIRSVLGEAIEAGGSTLRDHRQTDGSLGYFQHRFQVYGREGEACLAPGCIGTVQRIVQSGRSTFHCRRCQR